MSGRQAGAGCAASTAAALLQEGGNIEGNMTENAYIAVDLETTGLNPKEDRILEIGALLVRGGEVQEEFQRLVNPCCLLGETTVQITGITDEMAAGGAELKAAMEEFLDFCGDLPLLGHRVLFDYRFLKRAAVNLGHSFERSGMDTLELCRRLCQRRRRKIFRMPAGISGLPAWAATGPFGMPGAPIFCTRSWLGGTGPRMRNHFFPNR